MICKDKGQRVFKTVLLDELFFRACALQRPRNSVTYTSVEEKYL